LANLVAPWPLQSYLPAQRSVGLDFRSLGIALLYAAVLSWIYLVEITLHWGYMGFEGRFNYWGLALVLAGTAALATLTTATDTRGYILTSLAYIVFIPSLIYIGFGYETREHLAAFLMMIAIVVVVSKVELRTFDVGEASPPAILGAVITAILIGVAVQAWFGGTRYFNLNIELVYDYRQAAADELPPLFGYLYSNISSVLVPVALLLAVRFGSLFLVAVTLACSVLLFGMTQHKVVLFGPFAILFLYFFYRTKPRAWVIALAFISVPLLGVAEILIQRYVFEVNDYAYFNSLIIRRVFFFPPVLDSAYIEYFSVNAKYYWSASQLGGLFVTNTYGVTPPYVIGYEYFADADTSANTGLVGSGFANAGFLGVAIYSAVTGLMIALLNAYGKRIDHGFVTAVSLSTVYNIFTSTDLLTAFLTHGALMLFILLAFFPRNFERRDAAVLDQT
jgi:hypothetical protein